jgi:hypothetical protein
MALYRKRPVVIEAERADRDKLHLLSPAFRAAICHTTCDQGEFKYENGRAQPHIHTLEGVMHVSDGDWIIKGTAGEFYPCKPDVFEQNYERAGERVP